MTTSWRNVRMNLNLFHILLALLFQYEFKYKKTMTEGKKTGS